MGSHKAGSTNLSHLPPCLSPSLPLPSSTLSLNIESEPGLSAPSVKQREVMRGRRRRRRRRWGGGRAGGGVLSFHMQGGEERQGSAGSGLPVLSCERQTFGRVITRHTALGVISDSCLFKVFGVCSPYGLCLPCLCLMFTLHLHQEESCMRQLKWYNYEAPWVLNCLCCTGGIKKILCFRIKSRMAQI